MIKTTAIILASAASLSASPQTLTAPQPAPPVHFEVTVGPLNIVRENGATHYEIQTEATSLLRIELSSGKTINVQL